MKTAAVRPAPDGPAMLPPDPALPGLARVAGRARPGLTLEAVKHRPGRRMVVREHDLDRGRVIYWKLWAGHRAAAAARWHQELHRLAAGGRLCFRVPAVMGYWPKGRMLALAAARGEPIVRLAAGMRVEACGAAGRALASLHDAPWKPGRRWQLRDEAMVLQRACGWIRGADATLGLRAMRVADALARTWWEEQGVDGAPDPSESTGPVPPLLPELAPAPLHRDFHPGQVLHDAGGLPAVLDWDDAATGPAAIDVANFAAHVRLEALRAPSHATEWQEAEQAFLSSYFEARAVASWSGIDPFVAGTLLRLAGVAIERRGDRGEAHALILASEGACCARGRIPVSGRAGATAPVAPATRRSR